MLVLPWTSTIKAKSKLSNAMLRGSTPSDSETHLVLVNLLEHMDRTSLVNRFKDDGPVIIHKIANENVATAKE